MRTEFDAIVIGGGLAGATAALALGRKKMKTAFVAPPPGEPDPRTTALMMPSVTFLQSLGVWEAVAGTAAPMKTLRIVDGTRRLIRAPIATFHAGEIGETAFGYNCANAGLVEALTRSASARDTVTPVPARVLSASRRGDRDHIALDDGQILEAPLIVAADGRKSVARHAAGIGARTWRYRQCAVVLTFSHTRDHEGCSTEFHTEDGPFTQVPLEGPRSSLVWVVRPQDADRLCMLDPGTLARRIEDRMQSMLGAVTVDGPVRQFPLSGMIAHAFGRDRTVLVGEAAHVFPPIGAQGLNLGLRDVQALCDLLDDTAIAGDPGAIVGAYDRKRRADVTLRTTAVDMLNRSLLTPFLPVQALRGAGLAALEAFAPLRNLAMHEGMRPGGARSALKAAVSRKKPFRRTARPE